MINMKVKKEANYNNLYLIEVEVMQEFKQSVIGEMRSL